MLTTTPVSRSPGSFRRLDQAVLLSLLLLLPLPCAAQSADSGWSVEQWDSSQGLRHGQPQDIITAVVQSPDGYLWIVSLRQVWRFDGMRFDELEMPPVVEARIGRIYRLRIGATGELWIASAQALELGADFASRHLFVGKEGLHLRDGSAHAAGGGADASRGWGCRWSFRIRGPVFFPHPEEDDLDADLALELVTISGSMTSRIIT